MGESETVEVGCCQTVKPLEGMLKSNDSSMKNLMRCTKECGLDLVSLKELYFKSSEGWKQRDQLKGDKSHKA